MTTERISVMDLMGFEWDPTQSRGPTQRWKERYGELKAYFEKHGHCKMTSGTPLGRWCTRQRVEYRNWKRGERTSMTKTKYEALESINFDFGLSNTISLSKLRAQHFKNDIGNQEDGLVRWKMIFFPTVAFNFQI